MSLLLALAVPAQAQERDPAAIDQARRAAEAQAAQRTAREEAPLSRIDGGMVKGAGPFPTEAQCRPISRIVVDGELPTELRWVRRRVSGFEGRCIGQAGLNYILASLQSGFLEHGLSTTRAGLPQQDLASGTLHIAVIPGRIAGVRAQRGRRAWRHAFPQGAGDLLSLRAVEQGLDQMRRVPGRDVKVDLIPGDEPGESILDVAVRDGKPVSLSVSANNLAGPTVGRWQGSAQLSTLNLLGLSEVATVSINNRLRSPSLPADSRSTGASLSIPFGWWTFGVSANRSRYAQQVRGEVQDFETSGRLDTVSGWVERVVHRDRTSRTALRLTLQRRWGRSTIDGIEIGLQHQDLTDIGLALVDRHRIGRVQIDTEIGHRRGVGWLGAQAEPDNRPAVLPTARYRITSVDVAVNAPLGPVLAYRAAAHGQWSGRPLYGSDQIAVGGPFTVRGFDSDRALIGRAGWYLRQEMTVRIGDHLQPYVLADAGHVLGNAATPIGVGMGLRALMRGVSLDAWVAIPVSPRRAAGSQLGTIGVTAGWSF